MASLQLLLNVLAGEKSLQRGLMYAPVKVNCRELLVLLDTSGTHNFVVQCRVVDFGLKVEKSTYQVKTLNSAA